jgi:hypothetical protein
MGRRSTEFFLQNFAFVGRTDWDEIAAAPTGVTSRVGERCRRAGGDDPLFARVRRLHSEPVLEPCSRCLVGNKRTEAGEELVGLLLERVVGQIP